MTPRTMITIPYKPEAQARGIRDPGRDAARISLACAAGLDEEALGWGGDWMRRSASRRDVMQREAALTAAERA
jgi:hypothetical protein